MHTTHIHTHTHSPTHTRTHTHTAMYILYAYYTSALYVTAVEDTVITVTTITIRDDYTTENREEELINFITSLLVRVRIRVCTCVCILQLKESAKITKTLGGNNKREFYGIMMVPRKLFKSTKIKLSRQLTVLTFFFSSEILYLRTIINWKKKQVIPIEIRFNIPLTLESLTSTGRVIVYCRPRGNGYFILIKKTSCFIIAEQCIECVIHLLLLSRI